MSGRMIGAAVAGVSGIALFAYGMSSGKHHYLMPFNLEWCVCLRLAAPDLRNRFSLMMPVEYTTFCQELPLRQSLLLPLSKRRLVLFAADFQVSRYLLDYRSP